MAERRVAVTLRLDGNLTGRMALVAQAAHDMHVSREMWAATWEPHDWATF